jgi:hypothetical protein
MICTEHSNLRELNILNSSHGHVAYKQKHSQTTAMQTSVKLQLSREVNINIHNLPIPSRKKILSYQYVHAAILTGL